MDRKLDLSDVHKEQLRILNEIDRFCKTNNLVYMLAYGTLLGAVRHKGFIPWDNDVDIMVPMDDYKKLIATYHSDDYYIESPYTTPSYGLTFARIVDKKTYKKNEKTGLVQSGLFIDIYPIYDWADDREVVIKRIMLYEKHKKVVRKIIGGLRLARLYRFPKIYNALTEWLYKYQNKYARMQVDTINQITLGNSELIVCHGGISNMRDKFPKQWIEDVEYMKFEGREYPVPSKYHEILKLNYGDYMQFPPESERIPYHYLGWDYYLKE